jgi:hypothetical protein
MHCAPIPLREIGPRPRLAGVRRAAAKAGVLGEHGDVDGDLREEGEEVERGGARGLQLLERELLAALVRGMTTKDDGLWSAGWHTRPARAKPADPGSNHQWALP